ncbi:hypothetical protein RN001_004612 [Aquatica leii]|uniref:Uncharacterized protein n=1 Tax=Aquatica leii TaxID=1421715 RepID=A0AAN7SPL2_9COLE|nr:hypothetical protein RN001_004612 [Aquatica leii]
MLLYLIILYFALESRGENSIKDFVCVDGTQIKLNQVCDGMRDCPDNSDERRSLCYHLICPEDTFRCYYGACVNKLFRCDGLYQCADKSDESNCGQKQSCQLTEFQCSSLECIPQEQLCNGVNDCIDQSDEDSDICEEIKMVCPENTHHCKYGGCIKLESLCNGFRDCLDGSDESDLVCKNLNNQEIFCPALNSERSINKCELKGTGWMSCNDHLPVGTIVYSECKPYYTPTNNRENEYRATCQSDGVWSREPLKCEPECGKTDPIATPLIVHGWVEERGKWPWHSTLYKLNNGTWSFWCGGSLISEKIIITAAHCVWSVTSLTLKVALGKYYKEFEKTDDFTQVFDVEKIIYQPLYQDLLGNYGSDIAILVLNATVKFSEFVSPVCVDWTLNDASQHLSNNTLGMVVGMGITENDTYSDVLRATYLPVVDDETCIKSHLRDFKKYVTYTTFCAGWLNGTGVCNGDSGAGLVFPRSSNPTKWVLQGIVSVSPRRLGTSFCNPKYFTIFTKVGMYIDWMKNVIGNIQLGLSHSDDTYMI